MAITYLSGERIQGIKGTAVPASTGWTFVTGMALTSGTGITVTGTNQNYSYYDLGSTVPTTDNMVIDYDLTRTSGDHYDHPMLNLNSQLMQHGDVHTNGDSKIMLLYWANGNTGDGAGGAVSNAQFKESGTVTELSLGNSTSGFRQASGTTRYYRFYVSKAGDTTRQVRWSAWETDANRTAEGSTGRVINDVHGTPLGSGWSSANNLRYLIVENKNGNTANWIVSNIKIWSNVQSDGIADNMLSHTPTHTFNFTDVPAVDEKATVTNAPVGSRFEETDTMAIFRRSAGDENVGTSGTGGDWAEVVFDNSTIANNAVATGNAVTRSSGSDWTSWIRSSTNKLSPATGGGEVYFTQTGTGNHSFGLEKTPFNSAPSAVHTSRDYSFHTTSASNNMYEDTTSYSGTAYGGNSNEFRITMAANGAVVYYWRSGNSGSWTTERTSNVTASGDYYVSVSMGNTTSTVYCYIKSDANPAWKEKGTA